MIEKPVIADREQKVLDDLYNAIHHHDGGQVVDIYELLYDNTKMLLSLRAGNDRPIKDIDAKTVIGYVTVDMFLHDFLIDLKQEDWCDFGNTISECIRIIKEYKDEQEI